MGIKIYNTLSRKKEDFVTLTPGEVKMYVCGPTVYDFLHVGNFFGAIFFNVVRNWLEKRGYKVTYVLNYTDVDDKIIDRAKKEGCEAHEISEKYIAEYKKDFATLKLRPHSMNPKVTEYMDAITEFIADLIEHKKAYMLDGDVYYSVPSFEGYGKLSNKTVEDLVSGHRIEVNQKKQHAADFALWKKSKAGDPSWPSPWGPGRPGWHIECSAMNHAIFGEQIDIHGGGLDLTFPHHENEIAQSEGRSGKQFARFWMHTNLLTFGNVKMSKSLGNVRTARAFTEEYNGEILKFLILSSHYRSPVDFSQTQIDRTIDTVARFYSSLAFAERLMKSGLALTPVPEAFQKALTTAEEKIATALDDDDFNTAEVMAQFFELMRLFNSLCRTAGKVKPEQQAIAETYFHWMRDKGQLLSLLSESPSEFLVTIDDMLLQKKNVTRETVDKLVVERTEARATKNFAKADEVRKQLTEIGILVQDNPDGTTWEVNKSV